MQNGKPRGWWMVDSETREKIQITHITLPPFMCMGDKTRFTRKNLNSIVRNGSSNFSGVFPPSPFLCSVHCRKIWQLIFVHYCGFFLHIARPLAPCTNENAALEARCLNS